jgi:outer membrane receptor protein involved in Fe transport
MTTSGGSTPLSDYIATAESRYMLMRSKEKVANFPASEYTARLISKYTFANPSVLKGLSIGGSIRWASAPVIGYYKTKNSAGDDYLDTNRPCKGDATFYIDMFIGYQRMLRPNLQWKVQVNISNLFDDDDPVAVAAINSADAPDFYWVSYRHRPVNGRIVSLSTSLSF